MIREKYKVAKYMRLSREDGDDRESESIENQRDIIDTFISEHEDLEVAKEYVDDGYTGTNFNRPGFEKMLEDIEKERIKEFGFENGDRLLYLVAMQKTIDGQKRNPGAVYDNPNTDGDPIPAMNPPYSTMYVPLPSIEYLYSGSYQQP